MDYSINQSKSFESKMHNIGENDRILRSLCDLNSNQQWEPNGKMRYTVGW